MTRWRWRPGWEQQLLNTARVAEALGDAADVVEVGAKRRCPASADGSHGHPPGHLRDSIGQTRGRVGDVPHVDVGTSVDYALPVELGAKPHVIESHGDWPLRNRHTGQVFGRRVHHPGNPPQPYLRPAVDDLAGRRF